MNRLFYLLFIYCVDWSVCSCISLLTYLL